LCWEPARVTTKTALLLTSNVSPEETQAERGRRSVPGAPSRVRIFVWPFQATRRTFRRPVVGQSRSSRPVVGASRSTGRSGKSLRTVVYARVRYCVAKPGLIPRPAEGVAAISGAGRLHSPHLALERGVASSVMLIWLQKGTANRVRSPVDSTSRGQESLILRASNVLTVNGRSTTASASNTRPPRSKLTGNVDSILED
jgi:hypothetical protein